MAATRPEPKNGSTRPKATELRPCPHPSVMKELGAIVDDPHDWLNRAHPQFGDRKPIELVGTPEEFRIRNYINAVRYGLF
jgi:hypothetical protein